MRQINETVEVVKTAPHQAILETSFESRTVVIECGDPNTWGDGKITIGYTMGRFELKTNDDYCELSGGNGAARLQVSRMTAQFLRKAADAIDRQLDDETNEKAEAAQ